MSGYYIPVIGSFGRFELAAPFDNEPVKGISYTCQAVRSIADHIAANEDPLKTIYEKFGIAAEFETDVQNNELIVSLQSDVGHWVYVPARFILNYPSIDGVPYRAVALTIGLPSIPVSQSLDSLLTDMVEMAKGRLGVNASGKMTELSRVVEVSQEKHLELSAQRLARIGDSGSIMTKMVALETHNEALLLKVKLLEQYITRKYLEENPTPPVNPTPGTP